MRFSGWFRGRSGEGHGGEPRWLLPSATGLGCLVLGALAATYRLPGSSVAIWWPVAGVAVAAYALAWRRGRRAEVLGAVAVGVLGAELLAGYSLAVSLGYTVANLANPVICIGLLSRTTPTLQLRDAVGYGRFCAAATAGALVAGCLAAVTARLLLAGDVVEVLVAVVPSHLSAVLCIAPVALLRHRRPAPASRAETALQAAATLLVTLVVFGPWQQLPLAFLCLIPLVWGAARVSAPWLSLQVVLLAVVAAVTTTLGWGAYAATLAAHRLSPETVATVLDVMLLGIPLAVWPLSLALDVHRSSLADVQEARELLDSVLAGATGTAIVGADLDGVLTSWNAGAERMLGWTAHQVVGSRTLADLRVGAPPLEPVLARLLTPGAGDRTADWVDEDWDCLRDDGRRITVAFRLTARWSADGAAVGWIAVGEDVTEARRTERALHAALEHERQAVQRLEEVDAVKTSFVQSVSHELRTPLTSVLGYTDVLLGEQHGALTDQQRRMVTAVSRNGRRLLTLIEDLLTLSRVEQRAFAAVAERIDLRSTVQHGCDAVASYAEAASVRIEVDLGHDPVPVVGDPDQLERLTVSLLGNAVKFSPAGSVVRATVDSEDGEAVVAVSDRGMGIPAGDVARLFERFFRSSNAQRAQVQGSGLGLAIVKEVVDHHDGRVEVESEEGVGTTVRARLPLQAPAPAPTPAAQAGAG